MDGVSSDPSNHADPATTSPTVDMGAKSTLPYFASGQVPSGYTPATTGMGVGAAGLGGSPFNLSGPAV